MRVLLWVSLSVVASASLVCGLGCKKTKTTAPTTAATTKSGDSTAPTTGGGNTGYQAGGGAVQNIRQAARRTQVANDMRTLGQAIELKFNELGKMPTKQEILADLKQYANVLQSVNEGTIILTGTTDHAGLWAYETEADTKGGYGLVAAVPNRYDAATIKQYLGR